MENNSNIKYCPECGSQTDSNSDFCGECGYCFKNRNDDITPTKSVQSIHTTKNRNTSIVIIIAALICAFGIGCGGYFYFKADNSNNNKNVETDIILQSTPIPTAKVSSTIIPTQTPVTESSNITDTRAEYIFPDSDTIEINVKDLQGLTDEQLMIARNEIYARHGREFQTEWLQEYFDSCSWYVINQYYNYNDENSMLNRIELHNVKVIADYENSLK